MLREIGDEQEQAAVDARRLALADVLAHHAAGDPLGRRLRRRALGRARIGEFGAVSVVSGKISGETETLTLLVEKRFQNFDLAGAYAASALLALIALLHAARDDAAQPTEGGRMITVRDVTKRFGDFAALDDVSLEVPDGSLTALLGPERLGQVDAAARSSPGSRSPTPAASMIHGEDATARPAAAARDRLRLPALRRVQAHDGARQRRLRAEDPQAPEGRDRARASTSCSASSASPATTSATPTSSPAASASAWRSPARSRSSRACCCSTSRSARSTRRSAPSCASGCAGCTTRST